MIIRKLQYSRNKLFFKFYSKASLRPKLNITWTKDQGENRSKKVTLLTLDQTLQVVQSSIETRSWSFGNSKQFFEKTFLPADYNASTRPGFVSYCWWNALHVTSGTMTGTLATQAMLEALQFSSGTSTGVAATVNWIIKDGFGLFGGVMYAALISANFDSQPKRYRWIAGLALEAAMLLEILTPITTGIWSPSFLILASLSNIGKNMAWLAISATRASFHQSFALQGNLGDITAKVGAQSVAASFVGTILGVGLNWMVHLNSFNIALLWIPFAGVHMWTLYKSSNCVSTRTLDQQRFELACNYSLSKGRVKLNTFSPEKVSLQESFVLKQKSQIPIIIQPKLCRFSSKLIYNSFLWCVENNLPYCIHADQDPATISVWVSDPHSAETNFCAYFHCIVLRNLLLSSKKSPSELLEESLIIVRTISPQKIVESFKHSGWEVTVNFIFNNQKSLRVSL